MFVNCIGIFRRTTLLAFDLFGVRITKTYSVLPSGKFECSLYRVEIN